MRRTDEEVKEQKVKVDNLATWLAQFESFSLVGSIQNKHRITIFVTVL